MTDLENWNYYYKFDPTVNRLTRSNMLYTPLINPEGNIFCMNWDSKNDYQLKHGPRENFKELIDFFFNKEITNLSKFRNCKWSPEIIDIDHGRRRIFFKWHGETLNTIVYSDRTLDQVCPNWQHQLHSIVSGILDMGFYKPSLYPHCFFFDDDNILRTFDFYACISKENPFIEFELIKGMVGPNSMGRFDEAMNGSIVNVEILFKRALETYVKWPNDALVTVYNKLYS
jgi:hypothetical protein